MLKKAKFFYFCHLKKLVRPETFGPYYVGLDRTPGLQEIGTPRFPDNRYTKVVKL